MSIINWTSVAARLAPGLGLLASSRPTAPEAPPLVLFSDADILFSEYCAMQPNQSAYALVRIHNHDKNARSFSV